MTLIPRIKLIEHQLHITQIFAKLILMQLHLQEDGITTHHLIKGQPG